MGEQYEILDWFCLIVSTNNGFSGVLRDQWTIYYLLYNFYNETLILTETSPKRYDDKQFFGWGAARAKMGSHSLEEAASWGCC